jgi:hypothetical protein
MNQNTKDQELQHMQFRIDNLVGHFLKEDFPAIEYALPVFRNHRRNIVNKMLNKYHGKILT